MEFTAEYVERLQDDLDEMKSQRNMWFTVFVISFVGLISGILILGNCVQSLAIVHYL